MLDSKLGKKANSKANRESKKINAESIFGKTKATSYQITKRLVTLNFKYLKYL
jgi:hypothetical protein